MISLRPQSVDFQSSWENNCYKQLKSLFNPDSNEERPLSAINLYSNIYELCISFPENHTMTLLKSVAQLFFDSAIEIRQNIMGISTGSEALLELYVKEWNRYCVAFKAINGVCRYLNKCIRANYETAQYPSASSPGLHFQPVLIQLGSTRSERIELQITGIEDVAKSVWNNLIIRYFREKENDSLIKNFLSVLRLQNGNQNNLKTFVESFRWCDDLSLLAMVEEDSKEYYAKLSNQFIENNNTSTYVMFASEELSKELERTNFLWESDPEAIRIITRICEIELIENHKNKLQEEFEKMLQFGRVSDLKLLFKLLGKNEGTIVALKQSLSQLILKEFDVAYNSTYSFSHVIKNILDLYQKYLKFINAAFDNDDSMIKSLEDVMAEIVNQRIKRSWIIFSNYIDEVLKCKVLISEEVVGILRLFTLRSESFDEFVNEYKEKLSQRIVFNGGVVIESEELVIEIFRKADKLSAEQNCHLNRMLLDYKEKGDSVLVLTSHAWPSSCNPTIDDANEEIMIPDSLKALMQEFDNNYREIHCGRKIQWCPQLITLQCDNDTVMTLLQYQMIHSLPFKASDLTEIGQKLKVSLFELNSALKVLQEQEIVKFDTLNGSFYFSDLPSGLNLIPVKGSSLENENITIGNLSSGSSKMSIEIDSARQIRQSFILQSLIATILKRQRHTSPAELRKLLFSSLNSLKYGHAFVPQADEIDAAINGLIGKGYLEFNEQENLYIYVP